MWNTGKRQMKRTGNLFEQVAETDNLLLAFWKAKRGKEAKREVVVFSKDVSANIEKLQRSIRQGVVAVGSYHYFTIYDPKQRVICAASFPERVLHHALMNVCHPVFEKFQISDSYATRPGKGQYAAMERAMYFNQKNSWFCKLDIRKYFDSICHTILLQQLKRKFKDKQLLAIFSRIIDSYEVQPGRGIPIGNLTSQYFANFYLGFADHYVKEKLGVKGYVRYMDDMVIWGNCKAELRQLAVKFTGFLQDELQLTVKPLCLHRIEKGVPFLGYVLFRSHIRLNKHSKRRLIRRMKEYENLYRFGMWSQLELANHVVPLLAFTQHAQSKRLLNSILLDE